MTKQISAEEIERALEAARMAVMEEEQSQPVEPATTTNVEQFRRGMIFKQGGEIYIVTSVGNINGEDRYVLANMCTGTRYGDAKTLRELTRDLGDSLNYVGIANSPVISRLLHGNKIVR